MQLITLAPISWLRETSVLPLNCTKNYRADAQFIVFSVYLQHIIQFDCWRSRSIHSLRLTLDCPSGEFLVLCKV